LTVDELETTLAVCMGRGDAIVMLEVNGMQEKLENVKLVSQYTPENSYIGETIILLTDRASGLKTGREF